MAMIQCWLNVVPALNLHCVIVSWSLCGVYTLKGLKSTSPEIGNLDTGSVIDTPVTVWRDDDRPELKRSLDCKLAADQF